MQGIRIKKIREELGLTQDELAEKAGMSVQQINRYENNKTQKPSVDMVTSLAQALNVSTDYLLGLTDDPTPANLVNGLNTKERAAITAWRQGDYREAIMVIASDE